jgi:hypothetical protein
MATTRFVSTADWRTGYYWLQHFVTRWRHCTGRFSDGTFRNSRLAHTVRYTSDPELTELLTVVIMPLVSALFSVNVSGTHVSLISLHFPLPLQTRNWPWCHYQVDSLLVLSLLLGLCTVLMLAVLTTFRRFMLPPSSGSKWVDWMSVRVGYAEDPRKKGRWLVPCIYSTIAPLYSTHLTHVVLEVWASMYLRNVGNTANINTVQRPKNKINIITWSVLACFYAGFLLSLFFRPWRWRRHVPRKRQLTLNRLHGVITQKIILFIPTAVRTSDPTSLFLSSSSSWSRYSDGLQAGWPGFDSRQ